MSFLNDLASIGFDPAATATADDDTISAGLNPGDAGFTPELRKLSVGSPIARTLWHVCNGDRLTVVRGVAGGGKSTIAVSVAAYLARELGVASTLTAATVSQCDHLANLIRHQLDESMFRVHTGVVSSSGESDALVTIRPLNPLLRAYASARVDEDNGILIVDDAHQVTFAQALSVGASFSQLVIIGDPAQSAPTTVVDVDKWGDGPRSMVAPALGVFTADMRANLVDVTTSRRVGGALTGLVADRYEVFTPAQTGQDVTVVASLDDALAALGSEGTIAIIAATAHQRVVATANILVEQLIEDGRTVDIPADWSGRTWDHVIVIEPESEPVPGWLVTAWTRATATLTRVTRD